MAKRPRSTNGIIRKATTDAVRDAALDRYKCEYAKRKVPVVSGETILSFFSSGTSTPVS
ncbi:MAG: hypothetical protein ABSD89_05275 [Halobacteriota archaeon]